MRKTHTYGYIINEAEGDNDAGWYATYEKAVKAMKRYTEDELETLGPAIGRVLKDGTVSYEI